MEMNLTGEDDIHDDIQDFEIFYLSDTVNVLAYSLMAIGKLEKASIIFLINLKGSNFNWKLEFLSFAFQLKDI